MESNTFRLCLASVACYVQMGETSVTIRSNECTQFYYYYYYYYYCYYYYYYYYYYY